MARTDTLPHFLTDVADAIRTAEGTNETITASKFDERIEALSAGGDMSEYFNGTIMQGNSNSSGINHAIKKLPNNFFTVGLTNNLSYLFSKCSSLTEVPVLDTTGIEYFNDMFNGCAELLEIPLYNTSSAVYMNNFCASCRKITSVPALNTQNVENFSRAFFQCNLLEDIPVLNTSKATNMNEMFGQTPNLTDASLENVLTMCINATSYSRTKTLATLGFTATNYPASRIQGLSNYTAFTMAGWSIGY